MPESRSERMALASEACLTAKFQQASMVFGKPRPPPCVGKAVPDPSFARMLIETRPQQLSASLVLALLLSAAAPGEAAPAAKAKKPARPVAAVSKPVPEPPAPEHPQFVRDVAPLLDKLGCSTAACHGKFGGGRGDFQVSLLTLAPDDDWAPIVLGSRGRRVNLQEPEKSLLLTKATAQVAHGGGFRFKRDSRPYRTILNWLKDGAPLRAEDARLEAVSVEPPHSTLKVGEGKPLRVTARWSDGRTDDVTSMAVYASSDEPIATVTPEGRVTGVRWGGTAIQVRFLGNARASFVTLPQVRPGKATYPETPRVNVIDQFVFDNLKRMNVLPSGLASDSLFCRRIYLDTIGQIPTTVELDAFLADTDPDKRSKLIERLLERREFADLRTLRIADLLRVNPRKINNQGGFGERSALLFTEWIRDSITANKPWDQFVRELYTARGSLYFNGPASYWAIERNANDRAETTGQAFLGVRLQCARCHKHPFDRWNTDDYWDFSSFHGKVSLRNVAGGAFGEQEVVYNPGATVVNQSVNGRRKGLPAQLAFLGQPPMTEDQARGDLSKSLAEWITSRENPFFARATVNRLWSYYFGRGVVNPVDDMRATTPETVPGLLDALAKELVDHNFDIRHLIRLILNSRAYQLEATPNDSNALDDRFFSHFYPRPMPATVLLDVINQATGFTERLTAFPITRAVELPLPANNYFLTVFGQSHREYLTELDPKLEPNLVQTLHLMNSNYVNGKVSNGQALRELSRTKMDDAVMVRQAFRRTLCREPLQVETEAVMKTLGQTRTRDEAVRDLLWALIASREFLFVS